MVNKFINLEISDKIYKNPQKKYIYIYKKHPRTIKTNRKKKLN